jgi:prevent-host-death family protein
MGVNRKRPEKSIQVSVADAKRFLSELLGRVAYGKETITISKRGQPMARLVPVARQARPHLADVRGWLEDSDPFFSIMNEIVAERHSHKPRSSRRARLTRVSPRH